MGEQPEVPTEQMAQVLEKIGGPVVFKKIPVPKPGPDEVLVNVKYSGVCHTDLHTVLGDWPMEAKLPLVCGHEGAGVVVAKGEMVKDIEIGDHVGIKWTNSTCLTCAFCQQADESICQKAQMSGFTVNGTFQQYAVANAMHVARIPRECDLAGVAPVLCAGITVYKGLKESGARPGQYVAVVGAAGGLGSLALQYCNAMGLKSIAIDGGGDKKREWCMKLGASTYIDFATSKDIVADIKKATPDDLGPHAVLCLAVQEKAMHHACEYVRPRGTVVLIGLPKDAFLKANVFSMVVRMITVKGSYVGNRKDTAEALEFYQQGHIKAPFETVGLSELQKIFDMMREGKTTGRYVVDTSK